MRNIFLSVLFALFSFCVKAQIDSLYIRSFPQEFSIRPYFYKKFTTLNVHMKGQDELSYIPNTPVGLGIGFAYKGYALNLAYAPPAFRDKEKGKTAYIDFQYHYYGRRYVLDLFFQDYHGFYRTLDKKEEVFEFYPDVRVMQYGATGQYLFNYKKFSYRAAFYCDEQQVRSAGSFQVGGGVYYNDLRTDSTQILEGRDRFRNYQFSLMGGYVYSWVFGKNFFCTIGLSAGINMGIGDVKHYGKKLEITPNIFPRIAMGYNGKDWALFMYTVVNQTYVTQSSGRNIRLDSGRMQLSYVHRLGFTPGFLKKIKILNR